MSDELWFTKIGSVIFTQFKTRTKGILSPKFPKLKFTSDGENLENTKLPTVYFRELTPAERGMTLDNTSVNALFETIQITVYSQERKDVTEIMNACVLGMKQLRFSISGFPIYDRKKDIHYCVARFRRMIGEGDVF